MSVAQGSLGTSGLGHLIASSLSLCLSIACYVNNEWQKQDVEADLMEHMYNTKGLWFKCRDRMQTTYSCEKYDKFWISQSADLLAGRFGVGISMFFHLISLVFELLSLGCNTFLKHNAAGKRWNANVACICLFLSMLSLSIGVCWYGAEVGMAYNTDLEHQMMGSTVGSTTGGIRYVYGFGLFLGWLNMVIQILLTVVLIALVAAMPQPGTKDAGYIDGRDEMGNIGMTQYRPQNPNNFNTYDMSNNNNNYNSNYPVNETNQMQYTGGQDPMNENSYV